MATPPEVTPKPAPRSRPTLKEAAFARLTAHEAEASAPLPGGSGGECAHKWVFLRQNLSYPVPPDVFFCEKCLEKKQVAQ